MPLSLTLSSLSSRATRIASAGSTGIRRIATSGVSTSSGPNPSSPLVNFYDGLNRFGNSLMTSTINAINKIGSFSFSKLWGLIVSTALQITNFNWNITDTQLDQQIKQAEVAIAGARGALKGSALGYAICGLIPTATIAVFNEPMALYVLKELGEEAAEEIAGLAGNLIRLQLQQYVRTGFANLYKNYRSILRPAALTIANLLVKTGTLTQESVDAANKNRKKPWSFHSALEESIESIADPAKQQEAEETWEELAEACIEAGYIVAGSIDAYLAQTRISSGSILGSTRVVTIAPTRSAIPPVPSTPTPTP